ncbi:MAG: VIT1/CCC1 transporter family protein [Parachlamydiales bacterium]
MTKHTKDTHDHFQGKAALHHVVEKRTEAIRSFAEDHGTEIPGHISAMADAAREMALFLTLFTLLLTAIGLQMVPLLLGLGTSAFGYLVWKMGRSAHLGWARLERLHRVIAQEKWEIEHHRAQEREELEALYGAKGFEGKLLDEVVDVLMADQDRLLRVMVEEEMGLNLQVYEHPLKQCVGAGLGALLSALLALIGALLWFPYGLGIGAIVIFIGAGILAAHYQGNRWLPTVIWTLAIALLAVGVALFSLLFLLRLSNG